MMNYLQIATNKNILPDGASSSPHLLNPPKAFDGNIDTVKKHHERWMEMYGRLQEFRNANGHTLVPSNFQQDPELAVWVRNQRRRCTNERLRKLLDDMGFVWILRRRSSTVNTTKTHRKDSNPRGAPKRALKPNIFFLTNEQREEILCKVDDHSRRKIRERLKKLDAGGFTDNHRKRLLHALRMMVVRALQKASASSTAAVAATREQPSHDQSPTRDSSTNVNRGNQYCATMKSDSKHKAQDQGPTKNGCTFGEQDCNTAKIEQVLENIAPMSINEPFESAKWFPQENVPIQVSDDDDSSICSFGMDESIAGSRLWEGIDEVWDKPNVFVTSPSIKTEESRFDTKSMQALLQSQQTEMMYHKFEIMSQRHEIETLKSELELIKRDFAVYRRMQLQHPV